MRFFMGSSRETRRGRAHLLGGDSVGLLGAEEGGAVSDDERDRSFHRQLQEASERVAKWPEWKRAALGWLVVTSTEVEERTKARETHCHK